MKDIVNRTKRAARGLALADNLVVISIIGILIRLLLRAVQDTLRLREQANEEAWTTSIGPASVFIESLTSYPVGWGVCCHIPPTEAANRGVECPQHGELANGPTRKHCTSFP
jgi:hypothetical protein